MAKTNQDTHSYSDKVAYFKGRVDDVRLTAGQRRYAADRLRSLCGDDKSKVKTRTQCSAPVTTSNGKYDDGQTFAWGAGVGYGAAKAGKRVKVKDENKDSFRAGLKRGKSLR